MRQRGGASLTHAKRTEEVTLRARQNRTRREERPHIVALWTNQPEPQPQEGETHLHHLRKSSCLGTNVADYLIIFRYFSSRPTSLSDLLRFFAGATGTTLTSFG